MPCPDNTCTYVHISKYKQCSDHLQCHVCIVLSGLHGHCKLHCLACMGTAHVCHNATWALRTLLSGLHGHCACVSQCHMGTAHCAVWLAWALRMCVTMPHGHCALCCLACMGTVHVCHNVTWALRIVLSGLHGHCACVSQCLMGRVGGTQHSGDPRSEIRTSKGPAYAEKLSPNQREDIPHELLFLRPWRCHA